MKKGLEAMVKKSILVIVISILILCGIGMFFYEYNSLDNRLWRRLVADRPELSDCADEYEKLDIIRDWAYENVLFAGHPETYSNEAAHIYIQKLLDGEEITYGYYCGGIASVLGHVYTYLGYPACSLDMAACEGEEVLFSHVVTLVYINDEWIVQDPTFNLTYVDEQGKHMSIYEVRECVVNERELLPKRGKTVYADCIMASDSYTGIYKVAVDCAKKDDLYLYMQETNIDVWEEKKLILNEAFFTNIGREIDATVLYIYPWGVYFPNEYGEYVKDADSKYVELKIGLGIDNL